MVQLFTMLLSWLPPVLRVVSVGVFTIWTVVVLVRIVAFILDLIPFL